MKLGSLFSGIGGFDLAAERMGLTVAWQSEIDPYASAVLKKHWSDVPNHGDIREMRGGDVEPVDIVTAGFPCQSVSLAGKQLGDADERWMWPETIRIIREVRPRWVLLENVRGLLSADSGRLFGIVLRDLAESGFDVEWDCIPASAVGAPHIRDRVWIVAHATSFRCNEYQTLARGACQGKTQRWLRELTRNCDEWKWQPEPDVGRVADGVPRRVDRLRGLGNAIVPQVAEFIFRRILDCERSVA